MITYLRIDNVRSLVNFEWRPGSVNLLVGANGSGKTTVLSVLQVVAQLQRGRRIGECLTHTDLTWWQARDLQMITLRLRGDNGLTLDYELTVRHERRQQHAVIERERLSEDGKSLFEYSGRVVRLFNDDFSPGQSFDFGPSRSFIPEIQRAGDNTKLCWFRDYWQRALILKPDIFRLSSQTSDEDGELKQDASNFSSWWREMALSRPSAIARLGEKLADIIPGALSLRLADRNGVRTLALDLRRQGTTHTVPLEQLTEGQRALILLYSISECLDRASLVALDEALNYIAIAEVQPAVVALRESVVECDGQLLVVSHHPEVIDYLGADDTFVFSLKNGLSQCTPLREINLAGVRLSEYLTVSDDAM